MIVMVRQETVADAEAISALHRAAFGGQAEAQLVETLRRDGDLLLSLVAQTGGQIVGHIAYSPVRVGECRSGAALAPLAAHPDHQRRGVGSELMDISLKACAERGVQFVVVLGDPAYYSRFGFQPAKRWNLRDPFGGGEAFQAVELQPRSIPSGGGLVHFARAFDPFITEQQP